MIKQSSRSQLHLQMGQEVISILMALGLVAALILAFARLSPIDCADPANAAVPTCTSMASPSPTDDLKKQLSDAQRDTQNLKILTASITGDLKKQLSDAQNEVQSLKASLEALTASITAPPEKPPILNLTESGGFYFPSGSAELSANFEEKLRTIIIPEIVRLSAIYHADVIEVIGHTDGVPVRGNASTMDYKLVPFISRKSDSLPLITDNVGLGMTRAVSVLRGLRSDPRLQNMILLPLSAGQTTDQNDHLAPNEEPLPIPDERRRRIEIRLRRSFGG